MSLNIDKNASDGARLNSVGISTPTTEPSDLEQQLARILGRVPPLITLPKPATRCPFTGESRTGLVELIAPCARNNFQPPIRAIYRRAHKDARRGRWFIPAEGLFRYLLSLSEKSTEMYLEMVRARKALLQTETTSSGRKKRKPLTVH